MMSADGSASPAISSGCDLTLGLPYSPLAAIMRFKPLGLQALGLIAGIVILYFIAAEMVKRWFYHHYSV